jgi:hypothetical protein
LVRITLKKPFSDGTVAVDMDLLSLLCRLAASVPAPRFNTVRYAGALDVENLLNGRYRAAQFDTVSRLATEPAVGTPLNRVPPGVCGSNGRVAVSATAGSGGCEGVDFTPAYPFTVRVMTTLFLD